MPLTKKNILTCENESRIDSYETLRHHRYQSVAKLTDGNIVVAWCSDNMNTGTSYEVYFKLLQTNGKPIDNVQHLVCSYTTNSAAQQPQVPKVSALPNGKFIIIWHDYTPDGYPRAIKGQVFDTNGTPTLSQRILSDAIHPETQTIFPSVAGLKNGDFITTWQNLTYITSSSTRISSIVAKRFDHNMVSTGNSIELRKFTNGKYVTDPQVVELDNDNNIIIWNEYDPDEVSIFVYGAALDSNGNLVGSVFPLSSASQVFANPKISALNQGGYVAVWNGNDGSNRGIIAKILNNANQAVSGELQVNTYITGDQGMPDVTSLSDGGFLVTYASREQDGDGYGIYCRKFNSSGTPLGPEELVNTYVTGDQSTPVAIGLPNNGYGVYWTSANTTIDFTLGIYQKIFCGNPAPSSQPVATPLNQTPIISNPQPASNHPTSNSSSRATSSNRAPVFKKSIPDMEAKVGEFFSNIIPEDTFFDPDDDPLTYYATMENEAPLPSQVAFDPYNRKISGTLTTVGIERYSIWAKDPQNATARADFSIIGKLSSDITGGAWAAIFGSIGGFIGTVLSGIILFKCTQKPEEAKKNVESSDSQNVELEEEAKERSSELTL